MSALAGIFKFDPRERVGRGELLDLAHRLDRIGPDGGGEYVSANLGMAYRAFHTTPESRRERQPLIREGCILVWDGRLDNREELQARISRKYEQTPTDLDLVLASYKEWGAASFAELMGDWSLALWDEIKHELILARDYIGVRRLFYWLDADGIRWSSILEPLVLDSQQKLHLDFEYLAGCIYPRPPVEISPYKEIRSVPSSHFVTFQTGGRYTTKRYWALNPHGRIRFSSDADYEHHFREVFRTSVKRRLRADCPMLAELSGGLDSSSMVCVADDIRRESPGAPLQTISFYDADEPSGDERPYFSLIERRRGLTGHHIAKTDFARETASEMLAPLPDGYFSASPGYTAQSLRWASTIDAIQKRAGSRVILSGLGGDEILGGVQYEAPELAEHLVQGKLIFFLSSLYQWSLARQKTVLQLLGDTFDLLWAAYDPHALIALPEILLPWCCLKPSGRHPFLVQFARWRELSPSQVSMELIRYNLASQLAFTDPPLVGCTEKRYPYLDRSLYVFLASIPRTQVLRANHRRHLMRRALRGIVPDGVLFRKTKWFGSRSLLANLRNQADSMDALFERDWVSDGILFHARLVRTRLEGLQHGASAEGMQLLSAIGIELWLRSLLRQDRVVWAPVSGSETVAFQTSETCT